MAGIGRFGRRPSQGAGRLSAQNPGASANERRVAALTAELERDKLEGDPLRLFGNVADPNGQKSAPAGPASPIPAGDRIILRLTGSQKAALGIDADEAIFFQSRLVGFRWYCPTTAGMVLTSFEVSGLNYLSLMVGIPPDFVPAVSQPKATLDVKGTIAEGIVGTASSTTLTPETAFVEADATGGAITLTLPPAAGCVGRMYGVKRVNAGANAVVVDGNGAETIDGAASKSLDSQWACLIIISNGTNWLIRSTLGTVT